MSETVVCVGALVRKSTNLLLVRQSSGHSLEGQWTVPWGQIEPGESPTDAVVREIREESGIIAEVDGLIGMQELPEPWLGMIGILFLCRHIEGDPIPDMRETDAARYFDSDELARLQEPIEPLSKWLSERVLADEISAIGTNSNSPYSPKPSFL